MAKIKVKVGDTLSKLAQTYLGDASRWRELGKQIGITTEAQAKSLKPGSELNIPDTETDISGALGDAPVTVDTQAKSLPEAPEESFNALTAFRSILKRVTQQKANDARANALKAAGIDPSTISAGGLQSLVSLAQTATTPLSDIYTTTVDLLQQQEDAARSQLNLMISTGTIADASDSILTQFSRQTGMQFEVLSDLRDAAVEDRKRPVKSVTIEKGGRTVVVNLDQNGKIVSETDIGPAKPRSSTVDTQAAKDAERDAKQTQEQKEVSAFARSVSEDEDAIKDVPAALRGKVLIEIEEQKLDSIREDIRDISGEFETREQLIDFISEDYTEFERDRIASEVYTLIPDLEPAKPEEQFPDIPVGRAGGRILVN